MSRSENDELLKIYELYLNRMAKEGEYYWSRFNSYLTLNTGALVVTGYFLQGREGVFTEANIWLLGFIALIAAFSLGLSSSWMDAGKYGSENRSVISRKLIEIEQQMSISGSDLYSCFLRHKYDCPNIVETNIYIARLFSVLWIGVFATCMISFLAIVILGDNNIS